MERLDVIQLKNGQEIEGVVLKQEFGTITIKVIDSVSHREKVRIYQQGEVKNVFKQSKFKIGTPKSSGISSGISQNLISEQSQKDDILKQTISSHDNIQIPIMTNEPVIINAQRSTNPDDYFDPFSVPRPKRRERIWNREIRGFRAFLDYAYIQGIGKSKNNRFETAGSVGFQFNPIFYIGVGTAFDLTLNDADSSLPIFLNPRINFLDESTTPFWDLKVGYSAAMGKGFYCSTSLGISLSKKGKRALNLGLVYSLQNATYYDWSDTEPKTRIAFKPTYHGIAFKLTYEFGIGR
ncbi:hypothetical protein JGH11_17485 [Dysgonomonas sp. Marseille-P4677]|uniref:hypothetical protein n=1 Tax=Dysgonomonas sp. Marseille-P4677 TaxID=2364790 RepID=UPI001A5E09ED|nr:hypothetical protein [Dysgonomonas sp. Marseille-P4677]MBK5722671.1 hypothetical protein [Dysgonomonas sp. Marseille-P4677]